MCLATELKSSISLIFSSRLTSILVFTGISERQSVTTFISLARRTSKFASKHKLTISLLVKVLISGIPLGASKKSSVCSISSALEKLLFRSSLMMRPSRKRYETPNLVVLSACEAGHVDMVRAFSHAGCRYCIAPLHDPFFEDAAIFLTLFYKLLVGEKSSPWIAFKNTMTGLSQGLPRLSGAWSFYEWGEKCFIQE